LSTATVNALAKSCIDLGGGLLAEGGNRKGREGILGKRKQLGMPVAVGFVIAEKEDFNVSVVSGIFNVLERKQMERDYQICTTWKDKE